MSIFAGHGAPRNQGMNVSGERSDEETHGNNERCRGACPEPNWRGLNDKYLPKLTGRRRGLAPVPRRFHLHHLYPPEASRLPRARSKLNAALIRARWVKA